MAGEMARREAELRQRLRRQFREALLAAGTYAAGERTTNLRLDALMAAPALAELIAAAIEREEARHGR